MQPGFHIPVYMDIWFSPAAAVWVEGSASDSANKHREVYESQLTTLIF